MVLKLRSGAISKICFLFILLLFSASSLTELHAQHPDSEINLSEYDSTFTIGITGQEGWKMIASPVADLTFSDLGLRMQGLPGSEYPNSWSTVFYWNEKEGELVTPRSVREVMQPSQGYILYVFRDDQLKEQGIQGDFPKTIEVNRPINLDDVQVAVSATDYNDNGRIDGREGWNLLANPFNAEISVDKLIRRLQILDQHVSPHVWVWDPNAGNGNGAFQILGKRETIAPLQSFWIRYLTPGLESVLSMNLNSLFADQRGDRMDRSLDEQVSLELKLSHESQFDTYHLTFDKEGSVDMDYKDAFKIFSMKQSPLSLYGVLGGSTFLSHNVLPDKLDARMEMPIHFSTGKRGEFTFTWNRLNDLPAAWNIILIDKESGAQIDLRNEESYTFYLNTPAAAEKADEKHKPSFFADNTGEPRFMISIDPGNNRILSEDEPTENVQFNPNYPNPFNPTTTISFELQEQAHIKLSVWNYVGQKVATLIDEVREVGEHKIVWNAANMPSGFYIAKLEIGEKTYVRKMTLIK